MTSYGKQKIKTSWVDKYYTLNVVVRLYIIYNKEK